MTHEVLIVADDLTGALDVAGPFASRGHATHVAVDPLACRSTAFLDAEVLSINLTSRHVPELHAAALVSETLRRLCPKPPRIVIKKIDSTLRGNVVAEVLALLQATGRATAIVAPAFPAQGRTVEQGVVRVDGRPLADTAFARDALSPPPLEPLDVVFHRAAPGASVSIVPPGGPFRSADSGSLAIYIVDTRSDGELDRTVAALHDQFDQCVLVGSAGLAGAVARICPHAGTAQRPRPVTGEIAFVVGSRAETSALQVDALRRRDDAVIVDLPDGLTGSEAVLGAAGQIVVLRATRGEHAADPLEVARALAAAAVGLLRQRPIEALVATGGDTAIALLHALSCAHLRVLGEILPGIPCSELEAEGRPLRLLTKAGGFGKEGAFIELIDRLRRPAA